MKRPERKVAVLGYPIRHSLSPKLHGYWLKQYGISGSYEAIETAPEKLVETINRLNLEGYAGCNLTIPHKETILPLLDSVDATTAAIGAVNTLVFNGGKILGSNTDVYGFMENLRMYIPDESCFAQPVVLGAGGAARAVVWALAASGAQSVTVLARNVEKAKDITSLSPKIKLVEWQKIQEILPHASLLVNTTPLGMQGKDALNISLATLNRNAVVTDIVYNPLITPLLQEAQQRGHVTVDGLGMLIFQAVPAFEAWFGTRPEVNRAELETLKKELLVP